MAKHQGSCHCGNVRFTAELELSGLMACNCSICGRTGTIMAFVPQAAFSQTAGQDQLTDYQFGKKHIHHTFCKTCGIRPFGHGTDEKGETMYMINVRCLEGLDVHELTIATKFDGKSL